MCFMFRPVFNFSLPLSELNLRHFRQRNSWLNLASILDQKQLYLVQSEMRE